MRRSDQKTHTVRNEREAGSRPRRQYGGLVALSAAMLVAASTSCALAVSIELKDFASDRVERQRAATEGNLPLPGTPDLSRLNERMAEKGLKLGSPVLLRAFKSESEFEVWVRKDDAYVLFATYPVCNWSGTLGPKLREGDKQTPEGFYTVTRAQIHHIGRWPRSLNLGFPNVYDQVQARSGSNILVHGGCSSVGCFAMTNAVIDEIYAFTEQALAGGETFVPVHVFPFRMTTANLETQKNSPWYPFWINLKEAYDTFEKTGRPPRVSVCENHYTFQDTAPREGADPGPLAVCGETRAALEALERLPPAVLNQLSVLANPPVMAPRSLAADSHLYLMRPNLAGQGDGVRQVSSNLLSTPASARLFGLRQAQTRLPTNQLPPCSIRRASCRHYLAQQERVERRTGANRRRSQHAAR